MAHGQRTIDELNVCVPADWSGELSPAQARELALELVAAADVIDSW